MILKILTTTIVIIYIGFILFAKKGWQKAIAINGYDLKLNLPTVSVVIVFKNEKEHLPKLLNSFKKQTYPANLFEVIAINDNSNDNFDYSTLNCHNVKIITSKGNGKKEGVTEGISKATGDIILTTDADCIVPSSWIASMTSSLIKTSSNMALGSVALYKTTNSFFQSFQRSDFTALQLVGAGMALNNTPIFCNAANMAFYKKDWNEAVKIQKGKRFASGDDVFLLHAFKKLDKKIVYNKELTAQIITLPKENLKTFIKQRIRWGSKTVGYNDLPTILVATLVFVINLTLICQIFFSINNSQIFFSFIITLLLKAVLDYKLLKSGEAFFNNKTKFSQFLIFSLIYPFYIVLSAILGLFRKNKW